MSILIRNEAEADIKAIFEVTKAAFENHPYSKQTEPFIIEALRESKALTISLVAEFENRIIGHIAFSPVSISDGSLSWYGLGPISVLPKWQRQGIGKALLHKGLSLLKSMNAKGCILVGDPDYYQRFGFRNIPDLVIDGVPEKYVLALAFRENSARGTVKFHEGFKAKG